MCSIQQLVTAVDFPKMISSKIAGQTEVPGAHYNRFRPDASGLHGSLQGREHRKGRRQNIAAHSCKQQRMGLGQLFFMCLSSERQSGLRWRVNTLCTGRIDHFQQRKRDWKQRASHGVLSTSALFAQKPQSNSFGGRFHVQDRIVLKNADNL